MTPTECVEFLTEVNRPGGYWDAARLHKKREEIIAHSGGRYVPKKKGAKK